MSTKRNRATKRTDYSRVSPSPEWVAERAERLAVWVADGILTAEDVAVATGKVKPVNVYRRWPDSVAALAGIGVTVLTCGKGVAVVRCPHCGGRRKAYQGVHVANWLKIRRVPRCGYGTCKPEVTT